MFFIASYNPSRVVTLPLLDVKYVGCALTRAKPVLNKFLSPNSPAVPVYVTIIFCSLCMSSLFPFCFCDAKTNKKPPKNSSGWRLTTIYKNCVLILREPALFTTLQPDGWRFFYVLRQLVIGSLHPIGGTPTDKNILTKTQCITQEKNLQCAKLFMPGRIPIIVRRHKVHKIGHCYAYCV